MGSPPRMRERLDAFDNVLMKGRITPAYAGKTIDVLRNYKRLQDHPRVCGKDARLQ